MIRYILDSTGQILSSLVGSADMLGLNTPLNAIFIDSDEQPALNDYYDFSALRFVSVGSPTSKYHIFDYGLKQWIDPRTLDDIKAQKWTSLKTQRNSFEFGGFLFEGLLYDSDQVSQGRILGAVLAGQDQAWTTKDNIVVNLTATQLQALYAALQVHVAFAHERGRIARVALEAAQTVEEIDAIQL